MTISPLTSPMPPCPGKPCPPAGAPAQAAAGVARTGPATVAPEAPAAPDRLPQENPPETSPEISSGTSPEARYTVAVRALAEFAAREGSLDLRFTPSPSAQEGIAGHAAVAASRGEGYQAEVRLEGQWEGLTVRGRADGYDPAARRVEEVKTVRGEPVAIPDNHRKLHWAQAKVYGWLLCESLGLDSLDVAVVYYDIVGQREYPDVERHTAQALRHHFEALCARFLQWARAEVAHRVARDAALSALVFPHAAFRAGQRPLAEAVYKANVAAKVLLAQAPTGIGKSVGTVFPALKAMPGQRIDKLLFLCARSTGRAVALDAARRIRQAAVGAVPLRVLELVARDKACEHPGAACHGEACPLANGFFDRLPAARADACAEAQARPLDREAVREIARRHRVCPYFLAQEMARWSDLIVADYNYYFDRTALLHALATLNGWRLSVLVDEAHNLVERGRAMYTAPLSRKGLRDALRVAPVPARTALRRVARQWDLLARAQTMPESGYAVLPALPPKLLDALQQAGSVLLECMGEAPAANDDGTGGDGRGEGSRDGSREGALQQFCFDMLHFVQLAEQIGPHSLFDIEGTSASAWRTNGSGARAGRPESRLTVRNLVPAPFLRPRLAAAHSVTLFSATLDPRDYYADMLGLPEAHAFVAVPSPFDAAQLQVRVASRISTRFAHRAASLPAIVALIAGQYRERPGNYLAFFSSHDYLAQAAQQLAQRCPEIPQWVQSRHMDEAARMDFLDAFVAGGSGVGFAVLGGVFAEGVDLPGDRLIGAFVATLGLPQVNPVNEQLRDRLGQTFGRGYEYAYLYPGLRKVVQAAGRVIRTRDDRGVVYLIDDRFARAEVRALLPAWWEPRPCASCAD